MYFLFIIFNKSLKVLRRLTLVFIFNLTTNDEFFNKPNYEYIQNTGNTNIITPIPQQNRSDAHLPGI